MIRDCPQHPASRTLSALFGQCIFSSSWKWIRSTWLRLGDEDKVYVPVWFLWHAEANLFKDAASWGENATVGSHWSFRIWAGMERWLWRWRWRKLRWWAIKLNFQYNPGWKQWFCQYLERVGRGNFRACMLGLIQQVICLALTILYSLRRVDEYKICSKWYQ